MRIFANLFLILLLGDGTISLADELLTFYWNAGLLTWLRNTVAILVVLISFLLYFCIGLDKRLPKRILLPPIFFVFWSVLALWPLPAFFERSILGLTASAIQVLLGMAAMRYIRKLNGKSLLILKDMFKRHIFSIRYTLLFFTGNIIVIPIILASFAFSSANFHSHKKTAGFVRIGFDGIYMTEKMYRLDGKTVLLPSMIHIGEKSFYDQLVSSLNTGKTIILAEGITDRENLLQNRLSYGKIAEMFGLVSQETLKFKGRQGMLDNIEAHEPVADHPGTPLIIRADIDARRLRPDWVWNQVLVESFSKNI